MEIRNLLGVQHSRIPSLYIMIDHFLQPKSQEVLKMGKAKSALMSQFSSNWLKEPPTMVFLLEG